MSATALTGVLIWRATRAFGAIQGPLAAGRSAQAGIAMATATATLLSAAPAGVAVALALLLLDDRRDALRFGVSGLVAFIGIDAAAGRPPQPPSESR